MSHRRAKKIRKDMLEAGHSIDAHPYYINHKTGQTISSDGRRAYQMLKRKEKLERINADKSKHS